MKKKKSKAKGPTNFSSLTSYENEHITVIPNQINLTLCLACKKTLPNNDENIVTHLHGSKHQENVETLFLMCVPNISSFIPKSDLTEIVLKSKFDLSVVLKNKLKYLHRFENLIICLICEDIIAEMKTCNLALKEDICNHIQSEHHLSNIKSNICWVYEFQKNSGFLMFHKNIIFCSICDQTYQILESNIPQDVLDHLRSIHSKQINNPEKTSAHQKTNLSKQIQEENCNDTNKERDVGDISGNLDLERNISLDYLNCTNLIQMTNKFNTDLLKARTGKKLSIQGCNELICPECKGDVDIYNNDPKFSLDLHLEKHRDLSDVYNFDTKVEKDAEYTCPVCLEKILIFNKDLKLSMILHGCDATVATSNENSSVINYDTSLIFDHLKGTFKEQRDCIMIDGNDFSCKLCNCSFQLPNCFVDACKYVEAHLTELYHKEQYKMCNTKASGTFKKSSEKLDPWDLFDDENNSNTLSSINSVINQNSRYIEKFEYYYMCKVCKCCFLYFGIEEDILKTLAAHFLCKNHIKKLNRYLCGGIKDNVDEASKDSTCFSSTKSVPIKKVKTIFVKLRAIPGFQLNSEFLFVEGNTVCCKLCKLSFSCNQISKVRKHCYSETHSKILVENAANYIKCHENKQLLNPIDPRNKKFIYALNKLAVSCYRINDPTVTPNLIYISNNGKDFVCILCNTIIQFSLNGKSLMSHFSSTAHNQRIYDLACNVCSASVERTPRKVHCNKALISEVKDSNQILKLSDNISKISMEQQKDNLGITLKDLPENLLVHKEFMTWSNNQVHCKLCCESFKTVDLKSHVTDFGHKHGFFVELKSRITSDVRKEVRHLIFIMNRLYCVHCQCFIITQGDFSSICQAVNDHFKDHTNVVCS